MVESATLEVQLTSARPEEKIRLPKARFNLREFLIERWIFFNGFMAVILVVLITLFLIKDSLPFFGDVTLKQFLLGRDWDPMFEQPTYGLLPLLTGSFLVTFLALLIALPMGVIGAVFVSEMAPPRLKEILKPCIELIGAIPSVVFGFIGLAVVSSWMQNGFGLAALANHLGENHWLSLRITQWFPMPTGLCALVGAIMIAYMAIPTILSIGEDAINSVPRELRLASLGLGATKWETIWRVVVPAARRGIVAAALLGIGRAIGETMTVLMVCGNTPKITANPLNPVYTMTAAIAAETGETVQQSTHYHALFTVGLALLLISLLVNATSDFIMHREKQKS